MRSTLVSEGSEVNGDVKEPVSRHSLVLSREQLKGLKFNDNISCLFVQIARSSVDVRVRANVNATRNVHAHARASYIGTIIRATL